MMQLPASAYVPMTPMRTAACVLMLMFGLGLGEGNLARLDSMAEFYVLIGLTINYLCLLWYRGDITARGIPLSPMLGAGMMVCPLAALPYHLLRSRPVEERGEALGAFIGMLFLMPLARWAGILAHQAIRQLGA